MLTPEPIAELIQVVADGIPRSVRAPDYGVNQETLYQYHRRAKLY